MTKLFMALVAAGLLSGVAYAEDDKAAPPSGKEQKPPVSDAAKRREKENRERPPSTLPERHNQGNSGKKD